MQAIMLAAGKGSRLGKYTKDNTKCMLEVNGITLLERAINALLKADIHKLTLVLGYKKDNVKKFIKEKRLDKLINIYYIDNNDYDITNNIYSLYLASAAFAKDDTILLESDLIYDENIIKKLVDSEYENAAVIAKYEKWMDGTVVTIDDQNNITGFIEKQNFDYNMYDEYYKTVNIYKFSKDYIKNLYIPFLDAYVKAYGKNSYYELVLKAISSIGNSALKGFVLDDEKWYEIDDCQDLDIAELIFSEEDEKLYKYKKRFGGYWRFEGLKDYCYLVNPYFPTNQMIDKMKYSFDELIRAYPSTMYIENMCISRFFGIDEDKILVGNGAAELINQLRHVLKGKIGVIIPTFNEYVRCFPNNEIVEINTQKYDYKISKELLLSYIDKIDNLIIINPDNPSGSYLSKEDILDVVKEYNKKNKKVVFDESFIDFATKDKRYTLLEDDVLEKYKNLIVIKSISKSYGVAGLRLGVLCSSDKEELKIMKNNMPVWNINSFAEYFLQIFIPFKKDYINACDKIAEERKRFINELKKISYLKVYNSEANYVMCELKGIKAKELTLSLLKNNNILIKELSDKNGFDNVEMIRIAVKSKEDNDELISALKNYK